ncbi:Rve domain-containing protein [Melia azedarach]|uniref:Rve domain-containing protein n=1 Tax=Melia azedarach TaxID=155640 RepID=A0ACC1WV08_MELAZ|nr:Rve domain-containing protein [Melia azedarach]
MGRAQMKYAIVAIDYFTKWVETEILAIITEKKTTDFIRRNIVYRFGIPHAIIVDHEKQFDNNKFRCWCSELGMNLMFASPTHPQANEQVEATNKTIKKALKTKLDDKKGNWVDELPEVLWACRTTSRTAIGETPFSLSFGFEAIIPAEIGIPTYRITNFQEKKNYEALNLNLDLLEEKREESHIRVAVYQQRIARYYNKKVKARRFMEGDLVLRMVTLATRKPGEGAFGPSWEGPYKVIEAVRPGTYRLRHLDGRMISKPWNADMLKKYHP